MINKFIEDLQYYSGYIASYLLIISSVLCYVSNPNFGYMETPVFSVFGVIPETSYIFNYSLVISGILFGIFLFTLLEQLNIKKGKLLSTLVTIVTLGVILTGLFPMKFLETGKSFHWYSINIAMLAFILLIVIISNRVENHVPDYKVFSRKHVRRLVIAYLFFETLLKSTLLAQIFGISILVNWVNVSNYLILFKLNKRTTV